MNTWHEACGIIAIDGSGRPQAPDQDPTQHVLIQSLSNDLAHKVYMGLLSIQHRGQESAGIALAKDGVVQCYKDKGLVSEVFNDKILSVLSGDLFLGHVKYSGDGGNYAINAQPFVVNYKNGALAVAFNGALVNAQALRGQMENDGAVFTTRTDCELIALLIARNDAGDTADAVKKAARRLRGGYAIAVMTGSAIIGMRDPYGIRPLCLGTVEGRLTLASESCAFDMMDGTFLRDIAPGEIVRLENGNITSLFMEKPLGGERAGCIFEYVYFASPDSTMDGKNVYQCRERAGFIMAQESPVEADIVIGVPDSGSPAALGFSKGSGIPYTIGLIKNKYVGRTFIQPTQSQREMSVRIKLNPVKPVVEGKRVVLVDDSIVRGTTMRYLSTALRRAGAAEVHLRISSPPVSYSCHFGVDTPDPNHLIASGMNLAQICRELEVDSLEYLSIEGMLQSLDAGPGQYCIGCFNGHYPDMERFI